MSSTDGADHEWLMGDVVWDAVQMVARPKASSGSEGAAAPGAAKPRRLAARSANSCCQVEGCPCQTLPLRSYYQRQHICEEHFRALSITDASGRVTRFCQQCTKLEPLSNFDGERRSCRDSLERRNLRRQGRRSAAAAVPRGRRVAKAARTQRSPSSTTAARESNSSASGSASVTRLNGGSSPGVPELGAPQHSLTSAEDGVQPAAAASFKVVRGPLAASPAEARSTQDAAAAPAAGNGWLPPSAPPAVVVAAHGGLSAYWLKPGEAPWPLQLAAPAQALSDHSACFYAPPSPAALPSPLGAGAQPPLAGPPPAYQQPPQLHYVAAPPTAPPYAAASRLAGLGSGAGLGAHDLELLLSMDTDTLAEALLGGGGGGAPPAQLPSPADGFGGLSAGVALLAQLPQPAAHPQQHAQLAAHRQQPAAAVPPWEAHLAAASAPPAWQHAPLQPPAAPLGLSSAERAASAHLLGDMDGSLLGPDALPGGELDALLAELGGPDSAEETRVCFKLYGVRPEQLPSRLREELVSALALPNTVVQATLRAGCVHLTLTALLSAEERARLASPDAAAAVLSRLAPLAAALPGHRVVAQVGTSSAALLAQRPGGGGPALLVSVPLAPGGLPALAPSAPLAATVSGAAGRFRLRCGAALLSGGALGLHCRRGGRHLPLSLVPLGAAVPEPPTDDNSSDGEPAAEPGFEGGDTSGSDGEGDAVMADAEAAAPAGGAVEALAWVPDAAPHGADATPAPGRWQPGWGLYEFEVSQGALVGEALPLLLLPDAAAAAATELGRMAPGPLAASTLRLVGAVLTWQEDRLAAAAGGGADAARALAAKYPPAAAARLAAAARKLLAVAQRAGWPALAALLAPAAAEGNAPPAEPSAGAAAAPPAPHGSSKAAPPAPLSVSKPPPVADDAYKPSSSGKAVAPVVSGKLAAGTPQLPFGDPRRRVMHPAVLGAATLMVAGVVLGVGVALVTGHLA